jgi:hypothetical protein
MTRCALHCREVPVWMATGAFVHEGVMLWRHRRMLEVQIGPVRGPVAAQAVCRSDVRNVVKVADLTPARRRDEVVVAVTDVACWIGGGDRVEAPQRYGVPEVWLDGHPADGRVARLAVGDASVVGPVTVDALVPGHDTELDVVGVARIAVTRRALQRRVLAYEREDRGVIEVGRRPARGRVAVLARGQTIAVRFPVTVCTLVPGHDTELDVVGVARIAVTRRALQRRVLAYEREDRGVIEVGDQPAGVWQFWHVGRQSPCGSP